MDYFGELKQKTWKTARKLVKSVYPQLAEIIDEISPDDRFKLYKVKYPYGAMLVDKGVFFLPNADGHIVPLAHSSIPDDYRNDLDFAGALPVGLVTKNSIETFMVQGERITPFTLFGVGGVLALWRIFDKIESYQKIFWGISSGSRVIFMLPKITDQKGFGFLKKKYHLPLSSPKDLQGHWSIFSYLANHAEFEEPWSSEILYFSKEWFAHKNDNKWFKFYHYLLDKVWQESAFARNKMFFSYFFSVIQEKRNLKPNPYLADTVAHLIAICSGEAPGFIPARDNTAAPISGLQKIFVEDYRLKKYPPVIMHNHHFSLKEKIPVYYSFETPTTMQFSPKSNTALTTMAEMRGIKHITEVLFKEIQAGNLVIEDNPLFHLAQSLKIDFYHNEKDSSLEILPAKNLALLDKSLTKALVDNKQSTFAESSPFFRGCVAVSNLIP